MLKRGEIGAQRGALRDPSGTCELVALVSQVHRRYFIIYNTLANIQVNKFHAYFTLVINSESTNLLLLSRIPLTVGAAVKTLMWGRFNSMLLL